MNIIDEEDYSFGKCVMFPISFNAEEQQMFLYNIHCRMSLTFSFVSIKTNQSFFFLECMQKIIITLIECFEVYSEKKKQTYVGR